MGVGVREEERVEWRREMGEEVEWVGGWVKEEVGRGGGAVSSSVRACRSRRTPVMQPITTKPGQHW